jgi:hypothetical protein
MGRRTLAATHAHAHAASPGSNDAWHRQRRCLVRKNEPCSAAQRAPPRPIRCSSGSAVRHVPCNHAAIAARTIAIAIASRPTPLLMPVSSANVSSSNSGASVVGELWEELGGLDSADSFFAPRVGFLLSRSIVKKIFGFFYFFSSGLPEQFPCTEDATQRRRGGHESDVQRSVPTHER